MSRVPLGKVLLRNVIRHTGAHNKIQEESEMWKVRELEKHTDVVFGPKRRRTSLEHNKWDHSGYKELYPEEFNSDKSRMRSDGFDADGNREAVREEAAAAVTLREDALSVRAWNKKFYECEASIPDRWGHSGYKELYPEEFDTGSDREGKGKANDGDKPRRKTKKEQESHKRKRSKRTRKKKQKKRSHKKLKKRKKEQEESMETSSECDSSNDSADKPRKSKHKKKTRKKMVRKKPSSSGQESSSSSDEMSSSEEPKNEERKGRRTKKPRKKQQHHRSKSKKGTEIEERKRRRKNWKVAKDEGSDNSSDED
ncbi:uncharacterized protein NKAPD1 [Ascaphus truei]|uniref:uncharacterized protein NKAPD1 n=1 Tax=Ascaphus truei TaxID=8439 RepID=UPI003F5ABA74